MPEKVKLITFFAAGCELLAAEAIMNLFLLILFCLFYCNPVVCLMRKVFILLEFWKTMQAAGGAL